MNDELALAYLLNPTFELVNTNGKPLTGGYIEVYIAGSREKYYCYSDFDGTLHPFKIPLDSLGSNIVLAELDKSYDIYVYNKFGNLVMSRYNVVPVGSGSGSSNPNITISSNDETVQVENVSAGNFDLSISNTVDRVTALEEAIANIVSDSTAAYSIAHSNTTNNGTFNLTNDGVSGVEYLSDMTGWRLQSGHIYQMNFNAKLVSDVDRDRYIEGKLYLEGIDTVAQEWQFTLDDSYDHTESVNGSTVLYIPSNLPYYDVRLKYDSLVAPTLNKISIVDITSLIEHEQVESHTYTGVSGVIVDNTNDLIMADMDFINSQLNVEAQIASGIQIANEYTDTVVNNVSGNLVDIIETATGNIPEQVNADWNAVSGKAEILNKPDQITLVAGSNIGIFENGSTLTISASGVETSGFATKTELSTVSGTLQNEIDAVSASIVPQVNSDWEATSGVAEILNKPDLSIYATNEDLQIVSAAIPDVSEFATRTEVNTVSGQLENEIQTVSGAIPDISNLATKDELNIVSGMIPTDVVTHNEVSAVSGNLVNLINEVSGNIPEQVQSDWTESDTDSPAYIQHKPDLDVYATKTELVSGLNVVSGMIPDVSDFVTENELETVSGTIVNMIPVVTGYATTQALESVSGTLQNEIETVSGMIPDVSDFATHSEVASVSSTLQNEIDSIPEQVNADWDAVSGKAEILNKPEESSLLAGDGIAITTSGSDYVISSNAHTYTAGNYISIQNDVISVNGISPQVNSDWKAVAGVQAILNKPDESTLLAGDGISIAASGTDYVISSTVSAEPQVVTGINKTYYQGLDETFVTKINGYNIQAKVDQYGNVINTTYATKSQVNDLSDRVDAVSAAVSGQIPNIEITSPSGTLIINSSVSGNTKTYSIDVAPSASANGFEYGTFHATNNVTYDATMAKVKGNIDVTNDGKIKLKQGQSYHVTVRGAYNQTTPSDSTSTISYVEYISFDTITLNIDRSVTHSQFFELSYDLFNLASNVDYRILFTGLSGYINELYIDIHSISNSNTVTPVTGGTEYTAGYGIEILNNVISVSGIQPQVNSDWNSNSGKSQILNKPDLSVYATNNDLQVVSAAIPTVTPQVNSDWKAVSGVAQILNKPAESTLIAGNGISIAASGDDFVISSTVTGGGSTYSAGNGIDITDDTISVDTAVIPDISAVSAMIDAASANGNLFIARNYYPYTSYNEIMDAYNAGKYIVLQTQPDSTSQTITYSPLSRFDSNDNKFYFTDPLQYISQRYIRNSVTTWWIGRSGGWDGWNNIICPNWNETNTNSLSYIFNKPDQISLVAGSNIGIFENGNTLTISASAVDTSEFATKTELATVSGMIPDVSDFVTAPTVSSIASAYATGGGSGGSYNAGDYIDISNNTISVTGITDLVAGNSITITASGASAIISSTGEAQVQSDWNVTDSNSKAYIKNKPTIPAAQIQSDWNQTNTYAKDYIKNKPSIPRYTGASGININSNIVSLDNPVGLVAGDNITITVSGTSAIISAAIPTGVGTPYIAVPSAPASGNYVLKCIDGEIQWALNTLGG